MNELIFCSLSQIGILIERYTDRKKIQLIAIKNPYATSSFIVISLLVNRAIPPIKNKQVLT